ncbi:MFS transporter [Streptomyces sp. 8N616]|uniref:MFS transporter n=1 Tax=Streptomyces sp. 8N616 TaxID=3457414 RepID=UPI003FD2BA3B
MTSTLSHSHTPHTAPRPHPRLWVLLCVLAGNMLLDALEVSVVLVALPTIADDLALSLWDVQWVMSGFALGFAALLLLGPRVTARWGRRRVYLAALLVFAAASLVGGLTDSAALLIITRVVKGVCAALTAPTGLAIISTTFPEGPQQRRAVSVYSLFGAAGFTAGLLLSGILTGADWHWTILFPAPVALVLLPFAARLIPEEAKDQDAAVRRTAPPLLRAALLCNGPLTRSALGAATLNGTYLSLLLLTTFVLQNEHGFTPWQTALAFLPACLPLAVSVLFAGRMVARFGAPRLIALGALAPALGYGFQLVPFGKDGYATGLLPTLLLVGAGFVLAFAALNMQATASVSAADRALAVPLYQTGVQLGAVLMLCLVAAVRETFPGERPAVLLITAVGGLGLLVAVSGLRSSHSTRKGP